MSHTHAPYIAKIPDAAGYVDYTAEENAVWATLFKRQRALVETHACPEFLEGLSLINFPEDRVPQCAEVSDALMQATGWSVAPVAALIPDDEFFDLIAHRKFPAATFIRRPNELDYLKEPDIFHEFFGHCPLLTHPSYASFMQKFGEMALHADADTRAFLARLYWFTVEFGLINTPSGLRVYGGGILSSQQETRYAVEDKHPLRKPFDSLEALRTPYRIDVMQPIYFVIDTFDSLYHLMSEHTLDTISRAKNLGDYTLSV